MPSSDATSELQPTLLKTVHPPTHVATHFLVMQYLIPTAATHISFKTDTTKFRKLVFVLNTSNYYLKSLLLRLRHPLYLPHTDRLPCTRPHFKDVQLYTLIIRNSIDLKITRAYEMTRTSHVCCRERRRAWLHIPHYTWFALNVVPTARCRAVGLRPIYIPLVTSVPRTSADD
jgi:hypothetical protein